MEKKELKREIINILKTKGVDENTIKAIELITTEKKIRIETKDGKEYIQKGEVIHKRGLYENFCTINQNFTKYVGQCNLSKNGYRVLMYMLSYMEKDNLVTLTAANIKNLSGINAGNISKAIKELKEKKIIYQENLNGREKIYKVNYSINKNMAVKSRQTDKQYLNYHKSEMKAQERDMVLNGMEIPMRTNVAKGFFEGPQELLNGPKKENERSIIEIKNEKIQELEQKIKELKKNDTCTWDELLEADPHKSWDEFL